MLHRIKNKIKSILFATPPVASTKKITSSEYWTEHNVTLHQQFNSRQESLDYLSWRCDQYPGYDKLMPCSGFDGKVILDYGCGPGHDVAGFIEYSDPLKVIAMDVSPISLDEARQRLDLHNKADRVEFKLIKEYQGIPLEDNSVNYIHSSGVLHHVPDLPEILKNFYRILRQDGIVRIMVYNYNSIWAQLYVPYVRQILNGIDRGVDFKTAFRRSTDGENCPISNCYTPDEFISICNTAGFKTKFCGAAISMTEMAMLHHRFSAIANLNFKKEHRDFIKELTYNEQLFPLYKGQVAGIDSVFELRK